MNTTSIPIPPLEPQRGSSLVGKAYWVTLQRVTLIAAAIDVGYILLFMGLGSRPLAIVNFLSIAMYLGAYRLIQKRYNAAALVLIWVEVLGHAALGSLLIGWDSGFHYYLLLFIPAIVVAAGHITIGLGPGTPLITNRIERTPDLTRTDAWTLVTQVVATSAETNWTESLPADWTNAFYRVRIVE